MRKDNNSDVEEDTKNSSDFLADLNVEFHDRGLLANQKRFYKRSGRVESARKPLDKSNETSILTKKIDAKSKNKSEKGFVADSFDWDKESLSSEDEGLTLVKAFMAIAEDEPAVGKADARSGQWVEIAMKKVQQLMSMTDGDERKHVLDYTYVDLHYAEDQRKNLLSKFNSLKQELSSCKSELVDLKDTKKVIEKYNSSKVTIDQLLTEQVAGNIFCVLGGRGKRKVTISLKEVVFTKAEGSPIETIPEITFDSESECENQKPLPPLPKLSRAEPIGTSTYVIPHANLTQTSTVSDKTKQVANKESSTKVIKKKGQTKSPSVPNLSVVKKADSSTQQLLLTLMEEVIFDKESLEVLRIFTDNGFVAGQVALKAESSKVAKHEKACLENQHVFIPFAFDTFGFLAPEAEEFLNRVQRVVQIQQGDPLGPLLFALVLHPLVHRIRDCCQLLFHAWYLDDGTIIGDTKEVAKAIDIIRAEGPRLGLELNIKKTEVFWPSCNGVKVKEGLFPRDIGRPTLGVKLLGGAVSRDAGFISSLAVKRASRAVELMSLLPSLRDPQSELLLLRSCMGVAKLLFGLRTCQPMYIGEAVSIFDNGLRRAIEAIVVCGGPFFGDFQWRLASLPIRFGGLGLCSAEDVSTYAFVASRAQSWSLQDHILQGCGIDGADSDYGYALDRVRIEIVKSLGVSFDLSPRQKAVVECLRAPRAQNFLTVIPIEGLGQHMSALEYRTILKYRLMIPLFPVDEPCPVCRKVCLDSFGEHAVHCKELPGFKYRHDLVRDVLYDVLKRAGISSRKEAPVNFLTDPLEGRSTLRPADILVFGWAGGKHACVDLTGVSPLVGLRDNGFVAGQVALKAESSKVAKHEKACLENQHVFIPFAFDTFGFLAPEAEEFLNRVQRVVQSNFSTPKTQNFIFSRIGFAIQKGVAAQLVARLPAILL
ncbi:putative reverse transcriptase domain-containing protein [Tanacetum coccineum]|uniref:Reverse transcriptase domain-containing protein n=1 Tax=Tanacetum coccineum TaxID=301880 RepID=A0ABQ5DR21_9ASTR